MERFVLEYARYKSRVCHGKESINKVADILVEYASCKISMDEAMKALAEIEV